MVLHLAGSPGCAGVTPRYTHNPYTHHQPLLEVHSQPAYPAYYLREPRYGLLQPPPPPSPLLVLPSPDQRDLEVAYLWGHVAGLDRRSENPTPPPRGPHSWRTRPLDPTPLRRQSEGRRRRPRQRRRAQLSPEMIAVPWRPPRHRDDPRNPPTDGLPPPKGGTEGATGAGLMIVPAATAVRRTAGPTVPRSGMTSRDRRDAPPVAQPTPIVVATVLPPDTKTALTVARPVPPPKEGPTGGGTTPTGVRVGPPAWRQPGACAMMCRKFGDDLTGSLERPPTRALLI